MSDYSELKLCLSMAQAMPMDPRNRQTLIDAKDAIEKLESELAARDADIVALREALDADDQLVSLSDAVSYKGVNTVAPDPEVFVTIRAAMDSPDTQAAVNRVRADALQNAAERLMVNFDRTTEPFTPVTAHDWLIEQSSKLSNGDDS